MSHANALFTPRGRLRLASCVVEDGWTYARAAERFQCSTATAKKWADRYRAGGPAAMADLSSRPHHSPRRLSQRRERRIIKVRFTRRWVRTASLPTCGWPAPPSRPSCGATGCRCFSSWIRPAACRCAGHGHTATSIPQPGDLVHLDVTLFVFLVAQSRLAGHLDVRNALRCRISQCRTITASNGAVRVNWIVAALSIYGGVFPIDAPRGGVASASPNHRPCYSVGLLDIGRWVLWHPPVTMRHRTSASTGRCAQTHRAGIGGNTRTGLASTRVH
ncbi:transposase-like protein [Mycobacterium sp. URHB0021]